ncbi:E3 ubiquitin-protein ligase RNF25 isoform X3 [Physeter macrocephalus]|uniref:E3 ubiquitin-protein ligase RNF25 isoform X3 n=1 Tax=Physeter macrocephalus TaxID=9755 RepID=A0A2Y9FH63_PHYMC|nr:E3 ubiquitin-protein ligase RNF25 isoform X3 [Physeter catodon]|eukprot:XP_007121504.2 E3 ubiquitin-protein ligase RNF25 isoform X3 [Physeter catodon]
MAASASAAAGEEDWVLPSEVEVLESIYLDELQVVKGNGRSSPWEIYITLHPATAEDQDSQYVCFTLVLRVPAQYPHEVPQISIRNPRGLSDEQIHKISQALSHMAEAGLGTAMLYELIEKAVGVQCPVCREPLVYDLASLKAAPEPQQPMELYQPDAESLRQQEERKRLYQRQQERGGIIDLEAERNRYFISLQQPPAPLEPESAVDASGGSNPPSTLATEQSTSSTVQTTLSAPLPVASQYTCEKIPGAGPNQQKLGETQKAMLDPPRASRGPWRQPERRHLKGGECNALKGTSDTQELPPPEGPIKEPVDLKPESRNQGVEGPPQEKGHGNWQGPPPRRTHDFARWERSKGRTPASSYPRLPRGRGAYRPGPRREPVSLESEGGS